MKKNIKMLELFSGIGGFAYGLKQAGFTFTKHYYSDNDRHANAVYKKQFKKAIQLGSIHTFNLNQIEKTDLITFGSPCQDFSYEGSRQGLEGSKSKLLRKAIEIVRKLQPTIFIWENVKGAYSSNEGRDFQKIIQEFTHLRGYRLEWQLCNSNWLLPQNRERIYLIGHLDKKSKPCVFPFQEGDSDFKRTSQKKRTQRQWVQEQNFPTLTANYGQSTNTESFLYVNSGNLQGYETAFPGDFIDLSYPQSKERKSRVFNNTAKTLTTRGNLAVLMKEGLRRLTEGECEKLQGYPVNWTAQGIYDGDLKTVPKYQRYQLLGNAVSPPIIHLIGKRLLQAA